MFQTRVPAAAFLLAILALSATGRTAAQQQDGGGGAGQAPPAATSQPQPAPQPTFRGGIDFVAVDVFVNDRSGKPITDLTAADFEVFEDGKLQKVEQFKAIKIDGTPPPGEPVRQIRSTIDEQTEAQRDDVRVFLFFLDDYHTRDRNAVAVRSTLINFIETQLRPTDMLAVMYPLTPVSDIVFTRNHESIISAIQRFEGIKYNYTPRNAFEREYSNQPTDVVERIRNHVVTGALEGLSLQLGGVRDGRKAVIFVSEGLTVLLPKEMRRSNAEGGGSISDVISASTPGDPRVEAMAATQGQLDLESRMRDVYKAANRNNTAFYALDPRGLTPFEFDISDGTAIGVSQDSDRQMLSSTQQTLRDLSVETGGRAIMNRNSLGEGLAQIVRESSFYYLLGYTTPSAADGKFHEIRVRVKRSGTNVQSRKGYWAVTAAEMERLKAPRAPAAPKPVQQALASIATSVQAAKWVRTWVGTERAEGGKTRVTLTWEPLPLQTSVRREQAGRVSVLAADGQGSLVFRGRSPESSTASPGTNGPKGGAAGASSAPARRVSFDTAPGKLELRLTIEAAEGGTLDNETLTIDVPDFTAARATLTTPRVFRARTARDVQLISADPTAVPAASREFSRVERLLIRFDAYGPGSEKLAPTAVVLARNGQKVADLPVTAAAVGGTHQIDLGLNTMAAGEYVIEISVTDGAGQSDSELVPFRVGA
jgi:VWFA-related protein